MHARMRGVESFEKMSREGKIKKKVWVWKWKKNNNNRKVKKEKKYMWKNERKRIKIEKRSGKKDMRGMNQVKEKK
jgi:hypothetical protein